MLRNFSRVEIDSPAKERHDRYHQYSSMRCLVQSLEILSISSATAIRSMTLALRCGLVTKCSSSAETTRVESVRFGAD